jgi:hypothetical protein
LGSLLYVPLSGWAGLFDSSNSNAGIGLDAGIERLLHQTDEITLPVANVLRVDQEIPLALDRPQSDYIKLRYQLQNTLDQIHEGHDCSGVASQAQLNPPESARVDMFYVNKTPSDLTRWKLVPDEILANVPYGLPNLYGATNITSSLDSLRRYIPVDVKTVPQLFEFLNKEDQADIKKWETGAETLRTIMRTLKADTAEKKEYYDNVQAMLKDYERWIGHLKDVYAIDSSQFGKNAQLALVLRLRAAKTDVDISRAYREVAPYWTEDQKLDYVLSLGYIMHERFDSDRAAASVLAPGKVDRFQAFQAIFNDETTGVCRDSADVQARVLRDLGYKNAYVLTYNTSGPHATMIVQDTRDPKVVHSVNYDAKAETNTSLDVDPLIQLLDISTGRYLHKPDQGTVIRVLTERGAFLEEQTGGKAQDLEPFWQNLNPFSGSIKVINNGVEGNFFTGMLSDGHPIAGIARSAVYGDRDREGLNSGQGASFSLEMNPAGNNISATHLYLRQRVGWNSPRVVFTKELDTRIGASINANIDGTLVNFIKTRIPIGADGAIAGEASTETRFIKPEKGHETVLKAGTQMMMGLKDVRDVSITNVTPFHNVSYVSVDSSQKITPEIEALMGLAVGFRELGPHARAGLGIRDVDQSWEIKGIVQGSVDSGALAIAPGMRQEAILATQLDLKKKKDLPQWLEGLRGAIIQMSVSKTPDENGKPGVARGRVGTEYRF